MAGPIRMAKNIKSLLRGGEDAMKNPFLKGLKKGIDMAKKPRGLSGKNVSNAVKKGVTGVKKMKKEQGLMKLTDHFRRLNTF